MLLGKLKQMGFPTTGFLGGKVGAKGSNLQLADRSGCVHVNICIMIQVDKPLIFDRKSPATPNWW